MKEKFQRKGTKFLAGKKMQAWKVKILDQRQFSQWRCRRNGDGIPIRLHENGFVQLLFVSPGFLVFSKFIKKKKKNKKKLSKKGEKSSWVLPQNGRPQSLVIGLTAPLHWCFFRRSPPLLAPDPDLWPCLATRASAATPVWRATSGAGGTNASSATITIYAQIATRWEKSKTKTKFIAI